MYGLTKIIKNLSQESWYPRRDLNSEPLDNVQHKSRIVTYLLIKNLNFKVYEKGMLRSLIGGWGGGRKFDYKHNRFPNRGSVVA
jgi:hypothetical protein